MSSTRYREQSETAISPRGPSVDYHRWTVRLFIIGDNILLSAVSPGVSAGRFCHAYSTACILLYSGILSVTSCIIKTNDEVHVQGPLDVAFFFMFLQQYYEHDEENDRSTTMDLTCYHIILRLLLKLLLFCKQNHGRT